MRLKASPAKTEPRETEDDDDEDEGSEVDEYDEYDVADDRAAEMEHDASEANSVRENSDVSASSSFDFDVEEPDADDRGGARMMNAARNENAAEPTASPARSARAPTRRETRPALVSGATRLSASRTDPSLATAKAWLSEFAALGAKQRAAETALAGTLGDDADEYAAERQRIIQSV